MALLYSQSIKPLYTYSLSAQFGMVAITVYSGVQPDAATVASNWGSYNSEAEGILWHSTGYQFTQPSSTSTSWNCTTIPLPVTPLANGTGTWCIIWYGNPAISTIKMTGLPTNTFLVADVSSTAGTGCVRFASTTFSTSTAVAVIDAGFTVF